MAPLLPFASAAVQAAKARQWHVLEPGHQGGAQSGAAYHGLGSFRARHRAEGAQAPGRAHFLRVRPRRHASASIQSKHLESGQSFGRVGLPGHMCPAIAGQPQDVPQLQQEKVLVKMRRRCAPQSESDPQKFGWIALQR